MRRLLRISASGWSIVPIVMLLLSNALGQDRSPPEARQDSETVDPQEARVARLVTRLGSDSYLDREAADAALAKIGRPSRGQLEAASDAQDAEIRLRARRLLSRLKVSDLWSPTTVVLSKPNLNVSQALEEIAAQTGNHVLVGEEFGEFNNRMLLLDTSPTTFWEAIDEVCRQSENHVRPLFDPRPGVMMIAGASGKQPVAYSGPLRAYITGARRVFTEQLDYNRLTSDTEHTFKIDMKILWEDRFRLVAYRKAPQLIEAVTDTGKKLLPVKRASGRDVWNVTSSGMRHVSASIALRPPALSDGELDRFKLEWNMIAVGDMATIDVTDLESKQPRHGDHLELVVEKVGKVRRSDHYVVTVLILRDLIVPEPREILQHENRLELFDSEGRRFKPQGASSVLFDRGVRVTARFRMPTADAKPDRLQISYPRIRDQRTLEIEFRHVPIPIAKPE